MANSPPIIPTHNLSEILQWRAKHQPNKSAYTFLAKGETPDNSWTYKTLDTFATQVASALEGHTKGERVLLLLPSGLSFLSGFMGTLYAGLVAVPVPAHFDDPQRLKRILPRLQAIAEDAGAKVVLTTTPVLVHRDLIFSEAPALTDLKWIDLDALDTKKKNLNPDEINGVPSEVRADLAFSPKELSNDDLAFLQYSSGSTGSPKGVMVSHGNLIHNLAAIQSAFGHDAKTVAVSWLPAYHDMGLVADMLQPLFAGFEQIFMSPFDFIKRPMRWLEAISKYKATTSGAPNFAYALCTHKANLETIGNLDLSQWKVAYNCAEPVNAQVLSGFWETFASTGFESTAFFPYLGMAEGTLMVTAGQKEHFPKVFKASRRALKNNTIAVPQSQSDTHTFVSNGPAIPNQSLLIVDPETLMPCAEDQVGEIWVSGSSVAQGYWNKPEETKFAFGAMTSSGAGPFLRTGDLGFLNQDELFITGRLKDVLIVQGQNHYPQDIETTLENAHTSIRPGCSAAFVIQGEPESLGIVCEITSQKESRKDSDFEKIAQAIQTEVFSQHQLWLSQLSFLPARSLPKTSSGKVQRKATRERFLDNTLPSIYSFSLSENTIHSPPQTDTESILAGIFASLLNQPLPGREAHFFSLGGHSLLGTELQLQIRETLQKELPLKALFENPTLALLGKYLDAQTSMRHLPPLSPQIYPESMHLSHAQERLWFIDELSTYPSLYHISALWHLKGEFNPSAFHLAFNQLISEQESLRTSFSQDSQGRPLQRVHEPTFYPIEQRFTHSFSEALIAGRTFNQAPFDLKEAPLIRAGSYGFEGGFVLALTVHHLVADGGSMPLILNRLQSLYEYLVQTDSDLDTIINAKEGISAALSMDMSVKKSGDTARESNHYKSQIQYRDYTLWQGEWLKGRVYQEQLRFWTQTLDGMPELLALPSDRPRRAHERFCGKTLRFNLPDSLSQNIKTLAKQQDVTPFMLFLAAFQVLLYRYSNQDDFAVGVPIANHQDRALSKLVGFFVNTLVMRCDFSEPLSFDAFLADTKKRCLDAFTHQDLPFEKLVEALSPERQLSHHPLFQVMFVLQNAPLDSLSLAGAEIESLPLESQTSKFDLTLELIPQGVGYHGQIEFNTDLFDLSTIEGMISHFEILLESIHFDSSKSLGELNLLSENERLPLPARVESTEKSFEPIHYLIEKQALKNSKKIALHYESETFTYQELNTQANTLAQNLIKSGVKQADLVGIYLPRTPWILISILATLKAGATYVPLDPAYPKARLSHIFNEAQLPWILTHSALQNELPVGEYNALCVDTVELSSSLVSIPAIDPPDLSHVIFTSGSTGHPKGVAIRHRGVSALAQWAATVYSLEEWHAVLASTSICFDLSVFELLLPLTQGGSVVLVDTILDLTQLETPVTLINTVPSAIEEILRLKAIPQSVLTLNLAGEFLKTPLVNALYEKTSLQKIYDLYGPSEDTTYSTFTLREKDQPPSIGKPITGTQTYILDTGLNAVPSGVLGELYLGGEGLATGYLNRPDLTEERFIQTPFDSKRLYKTGDLVRRLPSGDLQYMGRTDTQIKLRGFRIELSEIESTLVALPGVSEAVVTPSHQDSSTLLGYLVPDFESLSLGYDQEQVSQWKSAYELTYEMKEPPVLGSDFSGWNSALTGNPLPLADMQEWRDQTVARILALNPQKIYEIGCGTGLLLAPIAPKVTSYWASDFSPSVIQTLQSQLIDFKDVKTWVAPADALPTALFEQGTFDTLILNSVVQYFPSLSYLLKVLRQSFEGLSQGGQIFLGDIRHWDWLPLMLTETLTIDSQTSKDTDFMSQYQELTYKVLQETELCLTPAFFMALKQEFPKIKTVEVLHKVGSFSHELSTYRFDVVLHTQEKETTEINWQACPGNLDDFVYTGSPVGFKGLINANLEQASQYHQWLESSHHTKDSVPFEPLASVGQTPQSFYAWGAKNEIPVRVYLSAHHFCFDVIIGEAGPYESLPETSLESRMTNHPALGQVQSQWVPEIKSKLALLLPEYMLPQVLIPLPYMPLLPNGKLKRKALPDPFQRVSDHAYIPPSTAIEKTLCETFAQVLLLPRVGVSDSFFDLGGHSLLATQWLALLRDELTLDIPLKAIFETPKIQGLAERIVRGDFGAGGLPDFDPSQKNESMSVPQSVPLSFAQERLWFMFQLEPLSALYNIPTALWLKGPLNRSYLKKSFEALYKQHPILRAFIQTDNEDTFIKFHTGSLPFTIHDLSSHPQAEDEAIQRAKAEALTPFDLTKEPLIRVDLYATEKETHLLFLNLHHLISDGWSLGRLLESLNQNYQKCMQGEALDQEPFIVGYADYAQWQRKALNSPLFQNQRDFWLKTLQSAEPQLNLPTDHPRPARFDHQGGHLQFLWNPEKSHAIQAFAKSQGVTPFILGLSVFQLLLARISLQSDISVGIPVANRPLQAFDAIQGLFVNTLVIRSQVTESLTFTEFLSQVKQSALNAYAHQDLPFEKVVEALNPERHMGHNPLFQALFVMQDKALDTLGLADLDISSVELGGGLSKFDLSLELTLTPGGIRGRLEYASALFSESTMQRLINMYEHLFSRCLQTPALTLSRLPLLSPETLEKVLYTWNHNTVNYPKDQTVYHFFEAQVLERPNQVALHFKGQSLTYQKLNEKANQLAHALIAKGVGRDVPVGVSLYRSFEVVIAVLGILKAGGAYVPLDPDYPKKRLDYLVSDSAVALILTHQPTDSLFECETLNLDTFERSTFSRENPNLDFDLDAMISIIYTSGSTGLPKGVMNLHRGAYNHLIWRQNHYQMTPDDRIMQKTSLNFDGSVWELFWTLMVGAQMFIPEPDAHKDSRYLCDFIQTHGITIIDFVPAMMHGFLNEPEAKNCHSLRHVLVGGEGMSTQGQDQFFDTFDIHLTHGYGPTETTITAIFWECSPKDSYHRVPIGKPLANTPIYLLDAHLNPVPIGVTGEIFIGGQGLARGYWRRPELTKDRFIDNPYAPGRLYRSGDLAYYLPDGNIVFVGRSDNQVKIRGFRVELGEIEEALLAVEGISEVLVIFEDNELLAYVVGTLSIAEMRLALKTHLPEHMIPAAFILLKVFPVGVNGKIDRKALPKPEKGRARVESEYIAPATDLARTLCELYESVLGIPQAGVHDSFFDLGGHSLLATQWVSRLRTQHQIELPLRVLFETPTVAGICKWLDENKSQPLLSEVLPVSRKGPMTLSFAQERLWFMDQLEPNSALYNIPAVLHLKGNLQYKALEKALSECVYRHEALRTRFDKLESGEIVQLIDPFSPLPLPINDLSSAEDPLASALAFAKSDSSAPFDLKTGPLIRASLLKLSQEGHILLLNIHHIVSDGWSWKVLNHELKAAYAHYLEHQTPFPWPVSTIHYADYAHWQKEGFNGDTLDKQMAYWQKELADLPLCLQWPSDRPRPSQQSYLGSRESFEWGLSLKEDLEQLAKKEGVTLFMLLLTAFNVLVGRYCETDDLPVGVPIANRRSKDLESVVGFFVNTLVIRGDLSHDPTFTELLQKIKTACLGGYAHQDLPFEKLVEELNPERSLSHHPLFQTLFVLQETALDFSLKDLEVTSIPSESLLSRFDLALEVLPHELGFTLRLEYSKELFDPQSIVRFVDHFETLLSAIIESPDSVISCLPLTSPSDSQSQEITPIPEFLGQTIPTAFEIQVHQTPKALAMKFQSQTLTYLQLNQNANQWAHYFQDQGLQKGAFVGMCLPRSIEALEVMLGIIKAGGVYLPMDPDYPLERLSLLIQDASPASIVSEIDLKRIYKGNLVIPSTIDISEYSQSNVEVSIEPSDPAYMIYTSGSTGKPKGVLLAHEGFCNMVATQIEIYKTSTDSRVLQHASLCFDASVHEIFTALLSGACVCIGTREELLPGPALEQYINALGVTQMTLPPSVLAHLPLPQNPGQFPLKTLIVAGEPCPTDLAQKWNDLCSVFNAYGPTEASVCTSVQPFVSGQPTLPMNGQAIPNMAQYILDSDLKPVPEGLPGELCLAGIGLALEYYNRPDLTATAFVSNPFGPGKLYRTGDRVRLLNSGQMLYLGRIDHQIKLRGFRIEPGEIESILRELPFVKEAHVSLQTEPDSAQLIAFIVPDQAVLTANDTATHVAGWEALYESNHQGAESDEHLGSNFKGWNSAITGGAIPEHEMTLWRMETVRHILKFNPKKVYEMGCGTGLLLSQIAPQVNHYEASDFSAETIKEVNALKSTKGWQNVHLSQRQAHNFDSLPQASFDTLILNSVAQYFPTLDYLYEVIEGALSLLESGGRFFLGDIRPLEWLPPYYLEGLLYKQPSASIDSLLIQMEEAILREEELCPSLHFFTSLRARFPRIQAVEILHKSGDYQNELNAYRCDVILHCDTLVVSPQIEWIRPSTPKEMNLNFLKDPRLLGMKNIPNGLLRHFETVKSDKSLQNESFQGDSYDYLPQDFYALTSEKVCVKVRPSEVLGCFDVLLSPQEELFLACELDVQTHTQRLGNAPLLKSKEKTFLPQIKAHLKASVPKHMQVHQIVFLEEFPLTPNGKLNRKALPKVGLSQKRTQPRTPPSTPEQARICLIFSEVLNQPEVGIHDSFFELGGHSLLATQLILRIQEQLNVSLPLKTLFQTPTVAGLSDALKTKSPAVKQQALPKAPLRDTLELSYSQGLWWTIFPDRSLLQHGIQNSYAALQLLGTLSFPVLEESIQYLIQRHESLRTHFKSIEKKPRRVISQGIDFTLKEVGCTGQGQSEVMQRLQSEAEAPFDLLTGPLIRATIYTQSDQRSLFMISISHLVFDGTSMKVVIQELGQIYDALLKNREPQLPSIRPYSDYVHWHRKWIKKTVLKKQMLYWLWKGKDMPVVLDIPTDKPRSESLTLRGDGIPFEIDALLTEELNQLAQSQGVTQYMILVGVFQVLLYQYSGNPDIFVGTPVANRPLKETENMVGLFLNFVVLREKMTGNPSFKDFLQRVKATCLGAFENQDLPFQMLVKTFRTFKTVTTLKAFQTQTTMRSNVMFNLVDDFGSAFDLGPMKGSLLPLKTQYSSQTLHLLITRHAQTLQGQLIYSSDLFHKETVEGLVKRYQELLQDFVTHPERSID